MRELLTTSCDTRTAAPYLYVTEARTWLDNEVLAEEVFGPLGLVITAESDAEMLEIARALQGQLTCTLHLDEADTAQGQALLPVLERKAGRVLANGFPTGVEVSDTMVHGGPLPGLHQLRRDVGGHVVHPPLPAPCLLPEHPRSIAAGGSAGGLSGRFEAEAVPANAEGPGDDPGTLFTTKSHLKRLTATVVFSAAGCNRVASSPRSDIAT